MPRNNYLRVLTLVLVAQAVLFYSVSHGDAVSLVSPLAAFPRTLGSWQTLQEGFVDEETQAVLRADDTLYRTYGAAGAGVGLFMAFFKTQRQGQSPHSPKNCLPGAGWQTTENGGGRMDVQVPGETIRINRYMVSKGEQQNLVLYWYQSQGRVIAGEFAAKFYLIEDSIRKHRSDTALVRIMVPVAKGQEARAEAIGRDFVQASYPVIKAYLPQ